MPQFKGQLLDGNAIVLKEVEGSYEETLPRKSAAALQYEGGFNHDQQIPSGIYKLICDDGRVLPIAVFGDGKLDGTFQYKFFDAP